MITFHLCFLYQLGSMLVSAASQSHTHSKPCCKRRLTEHGQSTGVVSTGFCYLGFHAGFQLSGYGGGHHGKGTMGRKLRAGPPGAKAMGTLTGFQVRFHVDPAGDTC